MSLPVLTSPPKVRDTVLAWRSAGLSVGFVPTMGALHEGHLALVRRSAAECDRTVVSVYVNPTQFDRRDDLENYPRRLESDCGLLQGAGANLVFAPSDEVMYPGGFCTYVVQEGLSDRLCGAFRPGHFRAVLTVVLKLFQIVPADRAYLGRKDFQQTVVIRRMAADLNLPIEIRVLPTVREGDGLALSSRNERLTAEHRRQAVCLYEALGAARRRFQAGEKSAARLIEMMKGAIARYPAARLQYIEIVSPDTLESVAQVSESSVAALAVFLGDVRLIDNMPFGECPDIFVGRGEGEAGASECAEGR